MAGRGRPGSVPQTDKREAYARLIAAGVSNLLACRMVGINPRAGSVGDTAARSPAAAVGACTIRW
jgi:hypothetical protein